jgi:hypothetical protein
MNIICLDLDDCILPNNVNSGFNDKEIYQILEKNLIKLVQLSKNINATFFLTSSWSIILNLDDGVFSFKKDLYSSYLPDTLPILSKYIGHNIVGLSNGDRYEDRRILLLEGHKLIIFDDMQFDEKENQLYFKTNNFIQDSYIEESIKWIEEQEQL